MKKSHTSFLTVATEVILNLSLRLIGHGAPTVGSFADIPHSWWKRAMNCKYGFSQYLSGSFVGDIGLRHYRTKLNEIRCRGASLEDISLTIFVVLLNRLCHEACHLRVTRLEQVEICLEVSLDHITVRLERFVILRKSLH